MNIIDNKWRYHSFFDDKNYIKSFAGKIIVNNKNILQTIIIDNFIFRFLARFKYFRRLFRLNRINIRELENGNILIIYKSKLYVLSNNKLVKKITFNFTRYVHNETILLNNNLIVIGEYGDSKGAYPVGVFVSNDFGLTWKKNNLQEPGIVKNILSVKYDSFEKKYWVFFGESKDESRIIVYNLDWTQFKVIGIGDLNYRAISSFFFVDNVIWFMNNPGGESFVITYNRNKEEIKVGYKFPGPIWYSYSTSNKFYLSTASEENTTDEVHLLSSDNCIDWTVIKTFKKDKLNKKLFLYGMLTFPEQIPKKNEIIIYCEAIEQFDNKTINLYN